MEEIGHRYGISKMAVSKRLKKILVGMRGLMETWDPAFFSFLVYNHLVSVLNSRSTSTQLVLVIVHMEIILKRRGE